MQEEREVDYDKEEINTERSEKAVIDFLVILLPKHINETDNDRLCEELVVVDASNLGDQGLYVIVLQDPINV